VVGVASCQVWEGPGSNNHTWQRLIKIGVVWGLHVHPHYRSQGVVAAQLLEHVVARWKAIGCTKGFVFAVSDEDAAAYRNLGFEPHNAMVMELGGAQSPNFVTADQRLANGLRFGSLQSAVALEAARQHAERLTEPRVGEALVADGVVISPEEEKLVTLLQTSGAQLSQEWSTLWVSA